MSELNSNLSQLKNYLYLVLDNLNELNDDNFEGNMDNVHSLIKQIDEKREFIKSNFSDENLKGKSDLLHSTVKQIVSRFDDIIRIKKSKQDEISSELSKILNKKKLINYQR